MARLQTGDRFPPLRVETVDGPQRLADRWRDGPLVISFMRHFGCTFCREHLEHLRARYAEITDAGADVVAVFHYGAQAARDFCDARELPFGCVGDPLRAAYADLDIGRGRGRELYGWGVVRRALPAYRTAGGTRGPQGGDIAQLPGTFVVASSGRVTLAHYARNAADNPSMATILKAIAAASGDA
ncbi:MAG: SelL-related redox protein [Solirubrobacteraceae bacterium]